MSRKVKDAVVNGKAREKRVYNPGEITEIQLRGGGGGGPRTPKEIPAEVLEYAEDLKQSWDKDTKFGFVVSPDEYLDVKKAIVAAGRLVNADREDNEKVSVRFWLRAPDDAEKAIAARYHKVEKAYTADSKDGAHKKGDVRMVRQELQPESDVYLIYFADDYKPRQNGTEG